LSFSHSLAFACQCVCAGMMENFFSVTTFGYRSGISSTDDSRSAFRPGTDVVIF
jgi:hypothetical protein